MRPRAVDGPAPDWLVEGSRLSPATDLPPPRRGTSWASVRSGREFGHDDQDRSARSKGGAVHQSEADLDRDEGDRHRAAPFEDERGLERRPQHLHRRVAVLTADHRDVRHLLVTSAECLERHETAQHVQEERAEVADLGESPVGDRPRRPPCRGGGRGSLR
jgi:hypothetical protein